MPAETTSLMAHRSQQTRDTHAPAHGESTRLTIQHPSSAPPTFIKRAGDCIEHVEELLNARRRRVAAEVLVKRCSPPNDQATLEPWSIVQPDCPQAIAHFVQRNSGMVVVANIPLDDVIVHEVARFLLNDMVNVRLEQQKLLERNNRSRMRHWSWPTRVRAVAA